MAMTPIALRTPVVDRNPAPTRGENEMHNFDQEYDLIYVYAGSSGDAPVHEERPRARSSRVSTNSWRHPVSR